MMTWLSATAPLIPHTAQPSTHNCDINAFFVAGVCDDDVAECYCPPETTYGLKPEDGRAGRLKARPMNNVHPKTVSGSQDAARKSIE